MSTGVDLLLVTGPSLVGKSSVARLLSDVLADAGVAHALIDADEFTRRGAHGPPGLQMRNLGSLWDGYAATGLSRLIVAWTVESSSDLESLEDAVPGARVKVCRLEAELEVLFERARRSEPPAIREQLQAAVLREVSRFAREGPGETAIETDGRTAMDVALELAHDSGWMTDDGEGRVLKGGRRAAGVVRVGDAVHRTMRKRSRYVHNLLRHLEDVGFDHAPRLLGTDDEGREILSFIDGWVPWRLEHWADEQIADAAALLRDYHDATTSSALKRKEEVVCHNDCSPRNFVFRAGRPIALIDFDAAAPGTRLKDVAYLCWMWITNRRGPSLEHQAHQLEVVMNAYGHDFRPELLEAIRARQAKVQGNLESLVSNDPGTAPRAREGGTWVRREMDWLAANHDSLAAGLNRGGALPC